MRAVLLRPLINEKSMGLKEQNLYTFEVAKEANKEQIARAVKDKFNVDVLKVLTINIKGKVKMQRSRRVTFQTAGVKKALVSIKKGQTIALFEAAPKEEEQVTVTTAEGEPVAMEKKELKSPKAKVKKEAKK